MASFLSEDLNESEVVSKGATRLTGWSLRSTGRRDRYVYFRDKNTSKITIVIPPGGTDKMSGLNETFPNGLSVESKGDGKLFANVFYEKGRAATSKAPPDFTPPPVKIEVTVNAEG